MNNTIKCPSCEAEGTFMGLSGTKCLWCKGAKVVGKNDAIRYATQLWNLAGGGYIAGEYTLEEMREQEAEANGIRKHFGMEPLRS